MKVFTAEQMRAFDRAATEEYGIPSIVLMENAALRVVEFLELKCGPLQQQRLVVVCGKGNNGGDGLAIARQLEAINCQPYVLLAAAPESYKGDALTNYEALRAALQGSDPPRLLDLLEDFQWRGTSRHEILSADIMIDAVLGTGFHGEVRDERLLAALALLNAAGPRGQGEPRAVRVAVDIPSGLNSDTGQGEPDTASDAAARTFPDPVNTREGQTVSHIYPVPKAVQADYTVTFAAPKRGLLLRDGVSAAGEIWVGALGTSPMQWDEVETQCHCVTRDQARSLLPARPLDAHKGDAGRVVLCGGSYGMSGAPTLAAHAALMAGAGLCIACLPDKILPLFATAFAEATSHPLPCDDEGRLVETAADRMPQYWEGAHVVALGPGLSRADGALALARRIMRECPHPLVIDADALHAVRAAAADLKQREAPTVLTPHPGEMGELMQMKVSDVQADRIGVAQECARKFNSTVVLKGARSIIALPAGWTYINLTGNPGMATGGSGDVLTGTISGLLAQLKDARRATVLGVYLHGLAGDLAYAEKGNGLIAGDIAAHLPAALLALQQHPEPATNARLVRLA